MMRTRMILVALLFVLAGAGSQVAAQDVQPRTWDPPSCEHTMNTNHFELAPGQVAKVSINLTDCDKGHEGIMFFGYRTSKNKSRQFTSRDNIRLSILDVATGQFWSSDSGRLYVASDGPVACVLSAENMGRKTLKVRLRSSVIW